MALGFNTFGAANPAMAKPALTMPTARPGASLPAMAAALAAKPVASPSIPQFPGTLPGLNVKPAATAGVASATPSAAPAPSTAPAPTPTPAPAPSNADPANAAPAPATDSGTGATDGSSSTDSTANADKDGKPTEAPTDTQDQMSAGHETGCWAHAAVAAAGATKSGQDIGSKVDELGADGDKLNGSGGSEEDEKEMMEKAGATDVEIADPSDLESLLDKNGSAIVNIPGHAVEVEKVGDKYYKRDSGDGSTTEISLEEIQSEANSVVSGKRASASKAA